MGERDQDGRRLKEAVGETAAVFAAALARGDALAASGAYASDATMLPPLAAPVRGRDAIAAFWRTGLEAGIVSVEFEAFVLEDGDRLAYELGRYELRLKPADGKAVTERGTYLLVHALQSDGSWRRAAEMLRPDTQRRQ
jgi:ketosteroid isomerase-like protein